MVSININEVNFAEIMTFLSVARTLNMSVSAEELYISQPAVSKRISRLENTYGLILFVRNNNGLQLTPAGKVFYEEMSESFKHVESAFTKAFTVQSGQLKEFNIGYDGFFDVPLLFEIIERFKAVYPSININIHLNQSENCDDLFSGQLDVMLRPDSTFKSVESYVRSESVGGFQFCILVDRGNPLSVKESLTIDDIADTPLTVARIHSDSPYVNAVKKIFLKYGHVPSFAKLVEHELLCFQILVSNGIGIASPGFWGRMNSRAADYFRDKIKIYPIPEEFYPMSFVWKAEGESPYIRKFIQIYRQVIEENDNRRVVWESYNGYG